MTAVVVISGSKEVNKHARALMCALADEAQRVATEQRADPNGQLLILHISFIQTIGNLINQFNKAYIAMMNDKRKKQHGGS